MSFLAHFYDKGFHPHMTYRSAVSRFLVLSAALLVGACDEAPQEQASASGEADAVGDVLGGTISDAMIPLDDVRSEAERLAGYSDIEQGEDDGGSGSRDSSRAPQRRSSTSNSESSSSSSGSSSSSSRSASDGQDPTGTAVTPAAPAAPVPAPAPAPQAAPPPAPEPVEAPSSSSSDDGGPIDLLPPLR